MNRSVISYSDIDSSPMHHNGGGGGRGGRRPNQNNYSGGGGRPNGGGDSGRWKKRKFRESVEHDRVHWDAQGQRNEGNVSVMYDAAEESSTQPASAMLVDKDSWDDTELIDAWDAAMEEYQRMHGPETDWKKPPVYKDSIWYDEAERMQWKDVTTNPVSAPSASAPAPTPAPLHMDEAPAQGEGQAEIALEDSETYKAAFSSLPDVQSLSKSDLFQKAVEASYWAGFWAAAYHAAPAPGSK